jgi:hypothetical protein
MSSASASTSANFRLSFDDNGNPIWESNDHIAKLRKGLENYQKLVKGNIDAIAGLTEIQMISKNGSVPKPQLQLIMMQCLHIIFNGAKINNTKNNWSVANCGAPWMDVDTSESGVDFIRVAFFSKNYFQGNWKSDKPIILQIFAEKYNN